MKDQNSENFWNDTDMDMIRSILEEDNTVPREMPASQRPEFHQPQNDAQPWDQPQRVSSQRVQPRESQPWDQPQQPAAQISQNAYRQENHNPFAGEMREREKPHGEGKGLAVFLIITIILELAVILGVCTSWYLWTH